MSKYISLRITPSFFNEETPFTDIYDVFTTAYKDNFTKLVIVEETATNLHYHISALTSTAKTTATDRMKKKWQGTKFYCEKSKNQKVKPYHAFTTQRQGKEHLDKAYRYLYKGKDCETLPIVIKTFHSPEEIADYHKRYWQLAEKLEQVKDCNNVEKAYAYLKNEFGSKLIGMKSLDIATELQYNKISKGKPPLHNHILKSYIIFIELKAKEEFGNKDLKSSIRHWLELEEW